MTNLELVQSLYQAFGRGDLPALLAAFAPDIEWVNPGPSTIRYFGTQRGPEAVARNIFGFVAENLNFEQFEPRDFFVSGDKVAVTLDMTAVVKHNQRRISQKVVHLFTFKNGKVTRFHDYQDNYALSQALAQ